MKKYLFTSLVIAVSIFFLSTGLASAQIGSMMGSENSPSETVVENSDHGESTTVVLEDILSKQQVTTLQELSCDQIDDDDLERLGEAVMEQQHPGEAHEAMDQMMGGEGSASLRRMHLNIGRNYLGCSGSYSQGMMGGGMMGMTGINGSAMGLSSMMSFGGGLMSMGGYGIFAGLTWLSLISFLLAGIYFFIKNSATVKKEEK